MWVSAFLCIVIILRDIIVTIGVCAQMYVVLVCVFCVRIKSPNVCNVGAFCMCAYLGYHVCHVCVCALCMCAFMAQISVMLVCVLCMCAH